MNRSKSDQRTAFRGKSWLLLIAGLILFAGSAYSQGFPGTDSMRNYNVRYITNNPATAFTNLRLHTLLRGIIDWIDTARSGTGGGGSIGVDTLYAVNDSTIRYRKNGVFRNFQLKGVYDMRRKVDTMYKVNDTTIGFRVNGVAKTFVYRGKPITEKLNDSTIVVGGDTLIIRGNDITKVPLTRTININGIEQDLSEDRTWTIPDSTISTGVYNLNFCAGDSMNIFTNSLDGSTVTQDSTGIHLVKASNSTNVWDNRLLLKRYGQTWTSTWEQTLTFVPNFAPGTTRQIGFGITTLTDNQLWPILGKPNEYFGFIVQLGSDASTSGYQGRVSASLSADNSYGLRFINGLVWSQGHTIQLTVKETDVNQFIVTIKNLTNGSKITGFLNYPIPASSHTEDYSYHSGYHSIYFDGGNFTVKNWAIDPKVEGVNFCWVGNSIGYGFGLDSVTKNNNRYITFNIDKDSIPVRGVLMARAGVTTADVNLALKEMLLYKPHYVVLDGIQTNDYFVSTDTAVSRAAYTALVKRIKAHGINVIHIVPAPRGVAFPSYGTFHRDLKNKILSEFAGDIIINDWDSLLLSGTPNSLDPRYYTGGDGTHLNNAGHAKRAAEFLKKIQFDYFRSRYTWRSVDTLYSRRFETDSAIVNTALKATRAEVRNQLIVYDSANQSLAISVVSNLDAFSRINLKNNSAHGGAAIGFLIQNNLNTSFQIYNGSSANSFRPDGALIRANGLTGLNIVAPKAPIYFQTSEITGYAADTAASKLTIDSFGTRLKVAPYAPLDTTTMKGIVRRTGDTRLLITDWPTFKFLAPAQTGNTGKVLSTDGTDASWGPIVTSGTYTPTLTNVANLDASTAFQCQYMRVGNVVTVSGKFDIDPTASTALTSLRMTLPSGLTSNFSAAENCGGAGNNGNMILMSLADPTNDEVLFSGISTSSLSSFSVFFSFTYLIQ